MSAWVSPLCSLSLISFSVILPETLFMQQSTIYFFYLSLTHTHKQFWCQESMSVKALFPPVWQGDRMWSFGVGLFLISLSPDSLQLPAVYGFSSGGATLLFAGLIGYWVDNTPRLTGNVRKCIQTVAMVFHFDSIFLINLSWIYDLSVTIIIITLHCEYLYLLWNVKECYTKHLSINWDLKRIGK